MYVPNALPVDIQCMQQESLMAQKLRFSMQMHPACERLMPLCVGFLIYYGKIEHNVKGLYYSCFCFVLPLLLILIYLCFLPYIWNPQPCKVLSIYRNFMWICVWLNIMFHLKFSSSTFTASVCHLFLQHFCLILILRSDYYYLYNKSAIIIYVYR